MAKTVRKRKAVKKVTAKKKQPPAKVSKKSNGKESNNGKKEVGSKATVRYRQYSGPSTVVPFETGFEVHENCPYAQKAVINIPWEVWNEVKAIQMAHPSTEFLVYFKGSQEGNVFNVTGISVPKQEVTSSTVDVIEPEYDVIGVLHKHPKGINSFSHTDDDYINSNNPMSILIVDGSDEIEAIARLEVPCGEMIRVDAKVNLVVDDKYKYEEKILERKYQSYKPQTVPPYRGHQRDSTLSLFFPRYPGEYDYSEYDKWLAEQEKGEIEDDGVRYEGGHKIIDTGDKSHPRCENPTLGMPCDHIGCRYNNDHTCVMGCPTPHKHLGEACGMTECMSNYQGRCMKGE